MSDMARGDTYDIHFKEKVQQLAEAEMNLLGDKGNPYLLTVYANAGNALTLEVMKVVERLADKAEGDVSQPHSIHDFQKMIGDWSRKTFPASTVDSTMRHLWKEIKELDDAVDKGDAQGTSEEAADLFILLIQLCNRAGISLEAAVRMKHEENLRRVWDAPDEHGVVYHTKGVE
jgi:NTP pyrophosphatase (non-canonical NTP hydrolase)